MPTHLCQALSLCSLFMCHYFLSVPQISHTDGCFSIQVLFQTITSLLMFSIYSKVVPPLPHTKGVL